MTRNIPRKKLKEKKVKLPKLSHLQDLDMDGMIKILCEGKRIYDTNDLLLQDSKPDTEAFNAAMLSSSYRKYIHNVYIIKNHVELPMATYYKTCQVN